MHSGPAAVIFAVRCVKDGMAVITRCKLLSIQVVKFGQVVSLGFVSYLKFRIGNFPVLGYGFIGRIIQHRKLQQILISLR